MSTPPEKIAHATVESRLRALGTGGVGPGLPRRRADRWILLHAAASTLPESELPEKELNERLRAWLTGMGPRVTLDHVSLRRALIDEGFVARDAYGVRYRRTQAYERRVVFEL